MEKMVPAQVPNKEKAGDYLVQTCAPKALSAAEIAVCIDILTTGDAVDVSSAKRDLPRAHLLATARILGQIVAVGSIKHERPWYAAKISRNSGVDFPCKTLELGYVAVHPDHGHKQLSQRLVKALLSQYEQRLFATTYSEYMKITLGRAGFVKKGKEWKSRKKQMLSFWDREI